MKKTTASILFTLWVFAVFGQTPPDSMQAMSHAYSLSLPMNRNGSGTGWQPDESPIYAYMMHRGKTMYMFHGNIFLRYNSQNFNHEGLRGHAHLIDAPNWTMAMVQRRMGHNGLLVFTGMFSLDPLTVGGRGYPLVFQTGETYNGRPIIDRQHPHDLFSGLTLGYTHRLHRDVDVYGYVGYPGEPALGPTAFMHRTSAMNNPDAPLGHHWQDATHITYGVGTVGFRYKIAKVEGSILSGHEPDENRFDFDAPHFDSYAWRFSINPHRTLAFQVSQAILQQEEHQAHTEITVLRSTASAAHTLPLGARNFIASSLIYGMNRKEGIPTHTALLESNLQMRRVAVYGRYEYTQKEAEELVLPQYSDEIFGIHAWTLGSNLKLATYFKTDILFGAQGSIFAAHPRLDPVYGRNPLSAEVYLNLRPTRWYANPHMETEHPSHPERQPARPRKEDGNHHHRHEHQH
jgi:hypothetical protein